MVDALQDFIPHAAFDQVTQLLSHGNLVVKIKAERKTRHGDYRRLLNGEHQITINSNLNTYRFLITLIHEIAHFEAYETYGKMIKPHGLEWKSVFQHLMLPFIRPEVFPNDVLPLLAMHFKNPKASSDSDTVLALKLKQYDAPNGKTFIFEVPEGSMFRLYNGKLFRKGSKKRTRFECTELASGRLYIFNPNAEVELINEGE
jgi:SprT protein